MRAEWTAIRNEAMAHLSKEQRWHLERRRAERLLRYSDDEPRDDHGRWTDGGGDDSSDSKPAAAKASIGKFLAQHVKDAVRTVGEKLKENQKELLGAAVSASLYHLAGIDFPMDVEEQLRDQVVHLADNAKVSVGMAREYMKNTVDALIAKHTKKAADDEDHVLKALRGLKHVLENSKLLDEAEEKEKDGADR